MVGHEEGTSGPSVRERILAATLEVIALDGLDAVRHRRVAELAGVSPGSTTYHFASREDLVEAAFLHYLDEATAVLGLLDVPADPAGRPAEALAAYVRGLLAREFLEPALVRAEYELVLHATRNPNLGRRLAEWEQAQTERVATYLRATGARAPDEGARVVVALIRGLELERLIHPERDDDPTRRISPVLAALWSRPPPTA